MKHAITCKFCHKPITVEIDDDFAKMWPELGKKLLAAASCNRCADLRVEKRHLEAKIKRAAMILHLSSKRDRAKLVESLRETFIEYTKQYANMIARWNNRDGMVWDEEVVNQIMEHPDNFGEFLGRLWRMFQSWQKQTEAGA